MVLVSLDLVLWFGLVLLVLYGLSRAGVPGVRFLVGLGLVVFFGGLVVELLGSWDWFLIGESQSGMSGG